MCLAVHFAFQYLVRRGLGVRDCAAKRRRDGEVEVERGRHPSKRGRRRESHTCLLCRAPEVVVNDLVRPFFLRAGLHGLDNPVLIDAHNVLATLTHAAFVAVVPANGGGLRGAVGTLEGEQHDARGKR